MAVVDLSRLEGVRRAYPVPDTGLITAGMYNLMVPGREGVGCVNACMYSSMHVCVYGNIGWTVLAFVVQDSTVKCCLIAVSPLFSKRVEVWVVIAMDE